VHFVTGDLDAGPIIAQRRVPIFADDTAQSLASRVLAQEHRLYPQVVRAIALGTVRPPKGLATGPRAAP
jgi:phosphoribosylglycinamide formyltransferase-1